MRAGLASSEASAGGLSGGVKAWASNWHTYLSRGGRSDAETMGMLGGDEPGKERGWQAGAADWSEEMVGAVTRDPQQQLRVHLIGNCMHTSSV
jgi:hypothetical protein